MVDLHHWAVDQLRRNLAIAVAILELDGTEDTEGRVINAAERLVNDAWVDAPAGECWYQPDTGRPQLRLIRGLVA